VEATPFIKVVFKRADGPLICHILLCTRFVTPATALALPIPSIRV
jgi:hypothetical protein